MNENARRRRVRGEPKPSRLPPLLIAALLCTVPLLVAAWTTSWGPENRETRPRSRLTIEIPWDQRAAVRSWETFFVCYGLTDHRIMQPTLEAWLRANDAIDFPRDGRIDVELAESEAAGTPSTEVQAVMTRVRERRSQYLRQCVQT
jgi:hypothetical protein